MRRIAPLSCRRRNKARVSSTGSCKRSASQAQGSATSGMPASVKDIRRCASSWSEGEMQSDMIGLLLGQVEHTQAGQAFNFIDGVADALRGCGSQYKPHVVLVFALIRSEEHTSELQSRPHLV